MGRPNLDDYYLGIAVAVSARAECTGLKVGAVLVRDNRVVSTGYNGTPEGWPNCSTGSCVRCKDSSLYGGTGNGYDKCICVHAEMNAIVAAARKGTALEGASAYVTHQPCITAVRYCIPITVNAETQKGTVELRDMHRKMLDLLNARKIPAPDVADELLATLQRFRESATS